MKKFFVITIVFIAMLTGIYFIGQHYYEKHFIPTLLISNENVSNMRIAEFINELENKYNYNFLVHDDGKTLEIPMSDILSDDWYEEVINDNVENSKLWFIKIFQTREVNPTKIPHINEPLLYKRVTNILSENRIAPEDAYFDENSLKIIPEVIGNTVNIDRVYARIKSSLILNKTEYFLTEDDYIRPNVTKNEKNLTKYIYTIKKMCYNDIKVNIYGNIFETISKETLRDWIICEDGVLDYDNQKIEKLIENLKSKYDGTNKFRTFTTSSRKTIKVGDEKPGFELNVEKTIQYIKSTGFNSQPETSCEWTTEGYSDEEFSTYIEISIKDQHMWFYKDGELILDTDVTTGRESIKRRKTPRGVFKVEEMLRNHTMRGSYGEAFCKYFIRVTWGGIAIHDASWRSVYGGNEYYYNGSHGCINTPYKKVSELWDELKKLDDYHIPIVIYDGTEEEVTN